LATGEKKSGENGRKDKVQMEGRKLVYPREKNSLGEFENEQKVFGMKTEMFGEKVFSI
jgi:hypothetical protein